MSQIVQAGQLNATALVVPDVYVQILAPSVATLNGVPTNVLGYVGVASWGPVNASITIGSAGDVLSKLGPITNRSSDLATACSVAIQQGANNMRAVRVSDGTDSAATLVMKDTAGAPEVGVTFTAKYTGVLGNLIQAAITGGSAASTHRLTLQMPGASPEVYDNIAGTGEALWQNIVAAVNLGNSAVRGPSQFVSAAVGTSTSAPATAVVTGSGGTDGSAAITTAKLIGVDGSLGTRTGMYALRGTGTSVASVVDCFDDTSWTSQVAFGLSEGVYMITAGAAGQNPADAVNAKATAGIDSYAIKVLLGDWCVWSDNANGVQRLLSPATFYAGLLANTAPQNSGLNRQVFGIVATQSSLNSQVYSSTDLQQLVQGGIDVITNPCPGGTYFGPRIGHNSSSNPAIQGDNYTRMTNYLASTLAAGMGRFIGQNQSTDKTDPTRAGAKATIDSFLVAMIGTGPSDRQIDSFSTILDLTNNSPSRIGQGYMQCDVTARYLSVVEKFIINLSGGQTVDVQRVSTQPQ